MARLRSFSASASGLCADSFSTSRNLAAAFAASRASFSAFSRISRSLHQRKRSRAASAADDDHASHPVLPGVTETIAMQSTGQGATQRSQPVQSAGITVCICLAAPTIASTGQACMHRVHPMQARSSITATGRSRSAPWTGLRGMTGLPSAAARRAMPCAPPGGHWL